MVKKEQRLGIVISAKSNKTSIVSVKIKSEDKKYTKFGWILRKYMVHNPNNLAKEGDIVIIEQIRPISRHKTWIIEDVLRIYP